MEQLRQSGFGRLPELFRRKKELEVFDQKVVRVIPFQLRWANTDHSPFNIEVFPDSDWSYIQSTIQDITLNPDNPLYNKFSRIKDSQQKHFAILFEGILPLGLVPLTHVVGIRKDLDSNNPGEFMFPGGKVEKDVNGVEQTCEQVALRELREEIHAYGINEEKLEPVGERQYSFLYKKRGVRKIIQDHETLMSIILPPFLRARSLSKMHLEESIHELTPNQVIQLFTDTELYDDESGQNLQLFENLRNSCDPSRSKYVETSEEAAITRERIIHTILAFEAKTRIEMIDRLLSITQHCQQADHQKRWDKIKVRYTNNQTDQHPNIFKRFFKDYESFLLTFERSFQTSDFTIYDNKLTSEMSAFLENNNIPLNHSRVKRRVRTVLELRKAMNSIILSETTSFLESIPIQKPYLLGQALIKRGLELSPDEMQDLKRFCPELAVIFETPCKIFGIDWENDPQWYEKIQVKLEEHARKKASQYGMTQEEHEEYKIAEGLFFEYFSDFLGIESKELVTLADKANNYVFYIASYLKSITIPHLQERLNLEQGFADVDSIEELMLVVFGLNQYTGKRDISQKIQWDAMKKILLMIQINNDEFTWNDHMNDFTYPFRSAFHTMTEKVDGGEKDIAPGVAYSQYKLKIKLKETTVQVDREPKRNPVFIDLSKYNNVTIFCKTRNKSLLSLTRKRTERGDNPDGVGDFFGRMIVIDKESFVEELVKDYGNLSKDEIEQVANAWALNVTETIVEWFENYITQNLHSQYDRRRIDGKGILSSLKEWLNAEEYRKSSASKISWNWLKFVHTAQSPHGKVINEEIQILPSRKDAYAKILDDARYQIERIFNSPTEDLFSLAKVYFDLNEAYEELARSIDQEALLT